MAQAAIDNFGAFRKQGLFANAFDLTSYAQSRTICSMPTADNDGADHGCGYPEQEKCSCLGVAISFTRETLCLFVGTRGELCSDGTPMPAARKTK